MKLIIDINEEVYSDTIHDSEYDTLQLGITLKEIIKNGIPLEEELEKINAQILSECPNTNARMICMSIIDKHIEELKGEK